MSRRKWTKEMVISEAKKYTMRGEWKKCSYASYRGAQSLNLLSKIDDMNIHKVLDLKKSKCLNKVHDFLKLNLTNSKITILNSNL
jgi:hypothetical protein